MDSFIQKAPARGVMLAYGRDGLVFRPYEIREGTLYAAGRGEMTETAFRECHLFDENTEWRFVRRAGGLEPVRLVLTRDEETRMDPDLIYEEEVLVKPEYAAEEGLPETLRIINRYRFADSDTLTLDNYRIALKG